MFSSWLHPIFRLRLEGGCTCAQKMCTLLALAAFELKQCKLAFVLVAMAELLSAT
jgi:hypothetical protein